VFLFSMNCGVRCLVHACNFCGKLCDPGTAGRSAAGIAGPQGQRSTSRTSRLAHMTSSRSAGLSQGDLGTAQPDQYAANVVLLGMCTADLQPVRAGECSPINAMGPSASQLCWMIVASPQQ
jgi:hypothetical protein